MPNAMLAVITDPISKGNCNQPSNPNMKIIGMEFSKS